MKFLLGLLGCAPFLFFPAVSHAEYIETFDADIVVHADSSVTIVETIVYNFDTPHHGISRTYSLIHPDAPKSLYEERIIDVVVDTVKMNDDVVPYTIEESADELTVRIGNPDTTIEGTHIYTIAYTVTGSISYPKFGGAELYWDVTGNEWQVPMRRVSARVSSPDSLFRSDRSCYRGPEGKAGSCDPVTEIDGAVQFSTTNLRPQEGMTIAQAIERSKIARVELIRMKWVWLIIPIGIIGLLYAAFRLYAYETTFKTGRAVIPQYEPYPNIKPMYTGLLFDGRLDARDVTACIVHLAAVGYLKIRKTEKKVLFLFEVDDYEITLIKAPDTMISRFEHTVLKLIFGSTYTSGTTISLTDLKNNLSQQRENAEILQTLRQDLTKDLEESGFFEKLSWTKFSPILVLGVLLPLGVIVSDVGSDVLIACAVFLLMGGLMSMGVLWRRRTRMGYEALDHLEGFKMFLEMTERDRYAFHNAPQKSPEQFMTFLPYAIAFGVEKEWANVFKNISIPNPEWYDGGSVGAFSAVNFTSSIGSFSTALTTSGAGASSGGGSSGGGAGGGGGGSW